VVCTISAPAATSTTSATCPTSSVAFAVAGTPASILTPSKIVVRNPFPDTRTR